MGLQGLVSGSSDEEDSGESSDVSDEEELTEDEIVALFERVGAFEPDADEHHQKVPTDKWGASGVPFTIETITGSHDPVGMVFSCYQLVSMFILTTLNHA